MKNFKFAVAAAAASLVSASSFAAGLTDAISTATTSATADVSTAGGLIIGVVVAVAAVSWIRRVIR